jgi:eukaryotic-like serine/threonine-protein kinase
VKTDRFQQLQQLFEQALEVPVERRQQWCVDACADNGDLLDPLQRLLARHLRIENAQTMRPMAVVQQALDARSDDERMPQHQVGRFTLQEEIGRGGMGRVFRAIRVEQGLTQEVAVKILRREVLSDPVIKRFMVERQVLAALNHPGIARLLDAGEAADGTPFVAMELIRGEPLLAYCSKHALGMAARLALFRQVLAAAAHAHRNLIVHRDIKPGNVMVDDTGQVKLLDFGIAKPLLGAASETATADRYLTPAYAAPEQFTNSSIGVACDVYALGALLYELLSGQPPFVLDERTTAEAERLILSTPPPALERAAELPDAEVRQRLGISDLRAWRRQLRGELDSIVQRALRKRITSRVGRYSPPAPIACIACASSSAAIA